MKLIMCYIILHAQSIKNNDKYFEIRKAQHNILIK